MPLRPNVNAAIQSRTTTDHETSNNAERGGTNTGISLNTKMQSFPSHFASGNPPNRRPSPSSLATTVVQDGASKLSLFPSKRRQSSIQNPRMPIGPRPLDLQTNKRIASSTMPQLSSTIRAVPARTVDDSPEPTLQPCDISRFSFSQLMSNSPPKRDMPSSFAFENNFLEPAFNFDDFHTNITTTEPSLHAFPMPSYGSGVTYDEISESMNLDKPKIHTQSVLSNSLRKTSGTGSIPRKTSGSISSIQQQQQQQQQQATTDSSTVPSTNAVRSRRQSHFPPTAFTTTGSRPPRKSIGPGTFVAPETSDNATGIARRPSVGSRKTNNDGQKSSLSARGFVRTHIIGQASGGSSREGSRSPLKSKPASLSSKKPSKDLLTPSRTPDPFRAPSTNLLATPNKQNTTPGGTATPSSNATTVTTRRASVVPPHATGLGARTISPTDARRMKRLSTLPPAPPLPQHRISHAPPTPQPDPALQIRPRSTAQSPALPNGKSVTPSSSRTTPDPSRKSYSSAQSLSSSTSYGSSRNPGLSIRTITNANSSRLPTPKPRTDLTPTNMIFEGEVPPVPAIPKAYESPGSELDQPYFDARSSSQPASDTPGSESPEVSTLVDAIGAIDIYRPSTTSNDASKAHIDPKKHTGTSRLPPINLAPINILTTNKIQMLHDSKLGRPDQPVTPSAGRTKMKTPSTPMTASKTTFYSRGLRPVEDVPVVRSSTSHHTLRMDDLKFSGNPSPNLPMFSFEVDEPGNRPISPFLSSSMPKTGDDYSNAMRPNFATGINQSSMKQRPNGPRAPSFSVTPRLESSQTPPEKPVENEFMFSPSALRRKLSRKRSESKINDTATDNIVESKYDNMPPPKLPASATWTGANAKSSTLVQKPSYLKSRRQASGSNAAVPPERKDSLDSPAFTGVVARPSMESGRSLLLASSRSGSVSTGTPAIPVGKSFAAPPSQSPELDRDDMIAEEEMRKLATKRKDVESAARELDSLRARAMPARRMSASTAVHTCDLNRFERGEIVDHPDVYFTGSHNARKILGDLSSVSSNFGYDDDRGDYNIVEGDHLAYRYEVVDVLGKGSFGQVVRCIDHKTGGLVAVKIIRNKKRFHQQALVEVNILQKLKEWDPEKIFSVINFDQSFYFRDHLCITTDLLGMNLYEFIKAHDFRGFSLKLIRRFTKQLLNSLVLLHKHKVIHCDLKPENILLAHPAQTEIKVIDFGSSCFENEKVYTYIQSRFYRSPEVILGMSYGMPIDMWSIGCILAELYTGYPIFPGENEQEQLACIMEIFGPPEKHLIEKSSRKKLFFDSMGKPRVTVSSKGKRRRPSSKDLRQALKCDDESFLDFITKCLRWDPTRRITPQEAVKHDFIIGTKIGAAKKAPPTAMSSPVKRINSVSNNTTGARPLPNPPPAGLKLASLTRSESLQPLNTKASARRQSTMNNSTITSQAKRASHAAMTSSTSQPNLARVTSGQRAAYSVRPDLAAATAAASLAK